MPGDGALAETWSEGITLNKKALMLGGVVAALLLAPQAMAQDAGWYGAFDLGYQWPEGVDAKSSNAAADGKPYDYNFKSEDGYYLGFVRLGYQFTPNWRVELEGGARGNKMESITGNPARLAVPDQVCSTKTLATCNSPGAYMAAYTVMGNVIYDFFPDGSFRPFIGAGVGANYVDVEVAGRFDSPNTGFLRIDDEDTAFAWQFLGGLAFDITDRLSGDLTYRYLDGNDISVAAQPQGKAAPDPGVFTGPYVDQSVTFGLRYSFAAAPPPPPPPPPTTSTSPRASRPRRPRRPRRAAAPSRTPATSRLRATNII